MRGVAELADAPDRDIDDIAHRLLLSKLKNGSVFVHTKATYVECPLEIV